MNRMIITLSLSLLTVGIGCKYSRTYYYRPIKRSSAKYSQTARHEISVAEEGRAFVSFKCSSRRIGKRDEATQKIVVAFSIANRSNKTFEFFSIESKITDDDDRSYTASSVKDNRDGKLEGILKLAPGSKQKGIIEFELAPEVDLSEIGLLLYQWAYRIDGEVHNETTKFLQTGPRNFYPTHPYYYNCRGGLFYYHGFYRRRF